MRLLSLLITCSILFACSSSRKTAKEPLPEPEPVTGRIVLLETELGNMTIALSDSTPLHRDNFINLVKKGFYDSLLFHRVIKDFMIQGGDPESKYAKPGQRLGNGGPGYTISAEFNDSLFHKKGMLAAARQTDDNVNPGKASSGCQFYIVQGKRFTDMELDQLEKNRLGGKKIPPARREVYKKNGGAPHLDGGYTVFGEVISGWEVIDKIAAVARDASNRPVADIRMRIKIIH
jgi:cyclophilin family peptidyl-prolyl cis-trans isomerase